MIARKYVFSGRVQGVGFRYATRQLAKGFSVTGTVQNLDDGSVELILQGDAGEVEDFVGELLNNSPLGHHVLEKHEYNIALRKDLKGFQILS